MGRIAGLDAGEVAAHADAPLATLFDSLMAREFAASLDARLGIGIDTLDRGRGETLRSLLMRLEADLQGVVDWEEGGAAYWSQVLRAAGDPVGSAAGGKALRGPLFGIGGPLFRRYFDFAVSGLEHLPEDRPYLIAANHASDLDGACVLMAVRPRVERLNIALAEDDFAGADFGRWFLRTFADIVPCDRHGDVAASLVAAQRLVGVRRPLLVFPEGNRSHNGQLRPFGTGVGLLAHELELPVVPLHIAGVRQVSLRGTRKPERQPLRLLFGAALEPQLFAGGNGAANSYEVYREIAVALRRRVENLGRKNI
jgi:1-acyl-sn-glycerol-3-phosphate acyltransferase